MHIIDILLGFLLHHVYECETVLHNELPMYALLAMNEMTRIQCKCYSLYLFCSDGDQANK